MNQVEIEYPASKLGGHELTFRTTEEITPAQLWTICLSSLHQHDYTIIQRPGERRMYAVVPIADARSRVIPTELPLFEGVMPGYQSIIVPLEHVSAEHMVGQIRALFGEIAGAKRSSGIGHVEIEPIADSQGILVSGLVEHVRVVLGLIDDRDRPERAVAHTMVEMRYRQASEVISTINEINTAMRRQGGQAFTSTLVTGPGELRIHIYGPAHEREVIEGMIREHDTPSQIETRLFDSCGYPLETLSTFIESMARDYSLRGSGTHWQLRQDAVTGTLIVTGTVSELAAVSSALDRLSTIPRDAQRKISMIEVHNREASKLRETVAQLLAARVLGGQAGYDGLPSDRSTDPQLGQPQGSVLTHAAPSQLSDLELAVDEELNVIIATGSPRRIEQVKQLVAQLDVRQPQVQLEVILLSLSESETRDLGVELAGNIDTGKTLIGLGSLFGISSISPSSASAQASGSGGSAVVLSPGDFSAVIRAIQTVNSGRSASMPSIVVNNNETATLNSTTTQPYLTTTITDSGTTTARGGSASAGTTITVSPQIAAGDHIVLDYSFTLSSFVGEASADGVEPPTQQTSLNSIATIPDGYTIVLGGIESTSEGDSDTKTPVLADIPLLGELFKSQSDSTSRSRFYVFIRATVMRSPSFEYLKYISEDLASEVGVDDGWPEVEPRIIR